MNRENCIIKINRLIKDEKVKNFIFNYENTREKRFLTDINNIPLYCSNVLVLSFGIIFSRFLEWKNLKNNSTSFENFSNSMIRIYNSLERAYDNFPVTFEYIDNLLLNLQIDYFLVRNNNDLNFFKELNLDDDYFRFRVNFSKIIYEIQKRRVSTRYSNSEMHFETLINFLEMFPFLNKISFVEYEVNNLFYESKLVDKWKKINIVLNDIHKDNTFNNELNMNFFLITNGRVFYYLQKINIFDNKTSEKKYPNKAQVIVFEYMEVCLKNRFNISVANKSELLPLLETEYVYIAPAIIEQIILFYDISKDIVSTEKTNYFFKDFFSLNNKYLKYLSIAISDTLTGELKERLYDKYNLIYPKIFELLKVGSLRQNFGLSNFDWDGVLTFLFLEEGVYKILLFILHETSGEFYKDVMDKFVLRFGEIGKVLSEKNKILFENPTAVLRPTDNHSLKKKNKCKVAAIISIASELFNHNKFDSASKLLPSDIDSRIVNIEKVFKSNRGILDKVNYFVENTIHVINMVIVFYSSFFAYAKEQNELEAKTDFLFDRNDIDVTLNKKRLIEVFRNAVKNNKELVMQNSFIKNRNLFENTNNKIEQITICKKLIDNAFEMLEKFNSACNDPNNIENKVLRKSLGKEILINESDLRKIKEDFFVFFNKEEKDDDYDDEDIKEIFEKCLKFFKYLQYGSFTESNDLYLYNAIYPLLGNFVNSVASRDGYNYSYFTIDLPNDDEAKIKVIIDDHFGFGEKYFCLPNIDRVARFSRADEEVWINPIIINYHYFSSDYNAKFCIQQDEKDYEKISELIYLTDPQIHTLLFGSIENAKIILPNLFKQKGVFSIDRYVSIKESDEVIAIGSIYKSSTRWDSDVVKSAFMDEKIELPKTFEDACDYFRDTFNDSNGKKYMICDICVDESHRNKGVGKFLLTNILKLSSKQKMDIVITVYENNTAAINLYKSLDFIECGVFSDIKGDNSKNYLRMIHFYNI